MNSVEVGSNDDSIDLIYFLCYPKGNRNKICVIDLQSDMSYEKKDWDIVNDEEFRDRNVAIKRAKDICRKYNKEYELFESRYGNEKEYLTDDEEYL